MLALLARKTKVAEKTILSGHPWMSGAAALITHEQTDPEQVCACVLGG